MNVMNARNGFVMRYLNLGGSSLVCNLDLSNVRVETERLMKEKGVKKLH